MAHRNAIKKYAETAGSFKSADLLELLDIGETRIRELLRELIADGVLIPEGGNRNRTYVLSSNVSIVE